MASVSSCQHDGFFHGPLWSLWLRKCIRYTYWASRLSFHGDLKPFLPHIRCSQYFPSFIIFADFLSTLYNNLAPNSVPIYLLGLLPPIFGKRLLLSRSSKAEAPAVNLCPNSILSSCCKVLERCVSDCLTAYFGQLLLREQRAFVKHQSTASHFVVFIHFIAKCLNLWQKAHAIIYRFLQNLSYRWWQYSSLQTLSTQLPLFNHLMALFLSIKPFLQSFCSWLFIPFLLSFFWCFTRLRIWPPSGPIFY